MDIMPTVLDLAQVQTPGYVQGTSLTPILEQRDKTGKKVIVTSWPLYNVGEVTRVVDSFEKGVVEPLPSTIRTKGWSLVYANSKWPAELYDLSADPGQTRNVIAEHPEVARDLHSAFVSELKTSGTDARYLEPRLKLGDIAS